LTEGNTLLIGRKSFEATRFSGLRCEIVVVSKNGYFPKNAHLINIHNDLVGFLMSWKAKNNDKKLVIAGGANVGRQALPFCDCLYIERILVNFKGNGSFYERMYSNDFELVRKKESRSEQLSLNGIVPNWFEIPTELQKWIRK
jgi:dihydrofolate reductase